MKKQKCYIDPERFKLEPLKQAQKKIKKRKQIKKHRGTMLRGRHNGDRFQGNFFIVPPKNVPLISDRVYLMVIKEFERLHGKLLKKISRDIFCRVNDEEYGGLFTILYGDPIADLAITNIFVQKKIASITCRLSFHSTGKMNSSAAAGDYLRKVIQRANNSQRPVGTFNMGSAWDVDIKIQGGQCPHVVRVKLRYLDERYMPEKYLFLDGAEFAELVLIGGASRGEDIIVEMQDSRRGFVAFMGLGKSAYEEFLLRHNICN